VVASSLPSRVIRSQPRPEPRSATGTATATATETETGPATATATCDRTEDVEVETEWRCYASGIIASNQANPHGPDLPADEGERRLVIPGVAWNDYVELNDRLGRPGLRMWY
jgi:hypothetical protein